MTEWTEGILKNEPEPHFAAVVKAAREQVLSGHYHSPVVMPGGIEEDETSSGTACDSTGLLTSFGLKAAQPLGQKPEEVVGKQNVMLVQEPLVLTVLVPRLLGTVAETGMFEEERALVRKDGSKLVGHLTVSPLLKRGEIVGCIGLTRYPSYA